MVIKRLILLLMVFAFCVMGAIAGGSAQEDAPVDAVQGVIERFDTYDVVALGEFHGLQQLGDFYIAVIQHLDFPSKVGNVIVEFGNSRFQDVMDRYLNGEDVPYDELEQVWTTTVGFGRNPMPVMYENFFAAVREVNRTLPEDDRIRVWLGDPDGTAMRSSDADVDRDGHYVDILIDNVLSQGEKALAIVGAGHLMRRGAMLSLEDERPSSVIQLLDEAYPDVTYVVGAHTGTATGIPAACNAEIEAEFSSFPVLLDVRGSWLETLLRRDDCSESVEGHISEDEPVWMDGYLYLAPVRDLMMSPYSADGETISLLNFMAWMAAN